MSRARKIASRQAGPEHAVLTVQGGSGAYRREPCEQCPWRVDQAGSFPPEAFRHSANTSYDMAEHAFACHMSGEQHPATCAGFLLRGAVHNLAVRMRLATGRIDPATITDGGHRLHASYRAMAVANGVEPHDPALKECRP